MRLCLPFCIASSSGANDSLSLFFFEEIVNLGLLNRAVGFIDSMTGVVIYYDSKASNTICCVPSRSPEMARLALEE